MGGLNFFLFFFYYTNYIWDSSVNFGYLASRQLASFYPYAFWGIVLEKIGLSSQAIQIFIFYISFAVSGLGFYLLSRKLGLEKRGSFIAGIIYMFSPYALIVAWDPAYGMTFPFYSFLPLNLYFFINFLTDKDKKNKIIYLLLIFLLYFGTSYSNPAFFILFFIVSLLFFLYFLSIRRNSRRNLLKNFVIFFLLYILLNLFWIFPFVSNLNSEFASANNVTAGLIADKETMKLNSVAVLDAFRLRGLWTTYVSQGFDDYYYDWHTKIYLPSYIIFSYVLSLLIIVALFFKKSYKKIATKKIILFMTILFLIGILLNSGFKSKGSLEIINSFIFTGYAERIFRTIYLKLGILLVIPAAFLIGYSVESIYYKIKNVHIKYAFFFFFLAFFFYFEGAPFLDGKIIKSEGNFLPSYNVKIPNEYYDLSMHDNYLKLDGRYISFPLSRSFNNILKWDEGGYNGGDFLRLFLNNKSLIYQHNNNDFINQIKENVLSNKQSNIIKILGLSNIKYIFNHYDLEPRAYFKGISATKDFKTEELENNNLKVIVSNKYFEVNAVNGSDFLPHFYTPTVIIATPNNIGALSNILSIPDYSKRSVIYFNEKNMMGLNDTETDFYKSNNKRKEVISNIKNKSSLFVKLFSPPGSVINQTENTKQMSSDINSFNLDSILSSNKANLYKSSNENVFNVIVSYDNKKQVVVLQTKSYAGIVINSEGLKEKKVILKEIEASVGDALKAGAYYLTIEADMNKSVAFNYDLNEIKIYKSRQNKEVHLINSFEDGLWQEKPSDCTNGMEGESQFSMQIAGDTTDGKNSLEIGSKNHYACTAKSFPVSLSKDKIYKYSLDYKNIKGDKVDFGYHILSKEKNYPFGKSIQAKNHEWNHFEDFIEPEEDIDNVALYFYAPSDGTQEVVNRFDNVKLEEWMPKDVFNYYLYSPAK
ncbi:MAG: hypothetical protein V1732_00930 [Patescibacteria group bacterium]